MYIFIGIVGFHSGLSVLDEHKLVHARYGPLVRVGTRSTPARLPGPKAPVIHRVEFDARDPKLFGDDTLIKFEIRVRPVKQFRPARFSGFYERIRVLEFPSASRQLLLTYELILTTQTGKVPRGVSSS